VEAWAIASAHLSDFSRIMTVDRWNLAAGDLTDQEWERLEPLLPSMTPQRCGQWRDHRQVVNGISWRIDDGAKWDQIPDRYGPAKTCYGRFARWEQDGTWARIEQRLQTDADACGDLDWRVQVDSSIVRAHQHAGGARKGEWPRPSRG
jgi:transposase